MDNVFHQDNQGDRVKKNNPNNEKPLRYYEHLRKRNVPYKTSVGSQVVEVEDGASVIRLVHLAQIMPLTDSNFFIYLDAPGLLALRHFNERSNAVVHNLSELLQGCNIFLTMDMLDSQFSPIVASSLLYNYFITQQQTLSRPQPAAIHGAALSRVSRPLAVLSGVYELPQISPSSTAANLDNNNGDSATTFGRTIPTNAGEAEATAVYLEQHMGVTHLAILYVRDDYGTSFQKDLALACERHGITVVSAAYQDGNPESSESALKVIKESNLRYIFGILQPGTFQGVLEQAHDMGLVGDDFVWYLSSIDEITEPGYALDRIKDAKLAAAIHGSQVVGLRSKEHPVFEAELSRLQTDPDFQSFFLESHPDAPVYQTVDLTERTPVISPFSYTAYDAVMSLGIAACQAEDYFFSGVDYFAQFKNTTFTGASGRVAFDQTTGTRKFDTLAYSFTNVIVDEEQSTDDKVVFKSRISTVVDFNSEQLVHEVAPTIYHDGTQIPPLYLPPLEVNTNLVPIGVLAVGWVLAGLLLLACVLLCFWVYKYRAKQIVRASQPFFLWMLLGGTAVMACSVIPMTFQEPQHGLDIACMATPWLLCCGFSTAFSAIFTKARRIRVVVKEAMGMQRVKIDPSDVMLPFVMLMMTNVLILTAWTVTSPLTWTHVAVDNNFDMFGRAVETYGACQGHIQEGDGLNLSSMFAVFLTVINGLVVVFAYYQSYLTRDMPTQFNESYYVSLCIAIMIEAFLLGVPILFLVNRDPTAYFIIRVLLVTSWCVAILGPHFVPKLYVQRRASTVKGAVMREWGSYVAQHHDHSHHGSKATISRDHSHDGNRSATSHDHHSRNGGRSGRTAECLDASLDDGSSDLGISEFACSVEQLKANIVRKSMVASSQPSNHHYASSVAELRASIAVKSQLSVRLSNHDSDAIARTSVDRNDIVQERKSMPPVSGRTRRGKAKGSLSSSMPPGTTSRVGFDGLSLLTEDTINDSLELH